MAVHALTPVAGAISVRPLARPAPTQPDEDTIAVPGTVRFPVELEPPAGFDPERVETWPRVEGRLEWVEGRLLYMPPCGTLQQQTVADVVTTLGIWLRSHAEFALGTNEAGMILRDGVRGADAAIWRRAALGPAHGGFARVPPTLAVEVSGRDEAETALRAKARWYLQRGVEVVWLLLVKEREVIVRTREGESRHRMGEHLPSHASLPDLTPTIADLFRQISA
jgi:Uma2 family endonuclease